MYLCYTIICFKTFLPNAFIHLYKEQIIMLNFLNLNWSDGTGNIFKKLSLQETLKYQARKNCF